MQRIHKGDDVIVTAGKNKGKRGKVKEMVLETDRVVVEGVNMIKRHTRRGTARQAGIVEREASIAASNVMPFCAKCGKGVRVGFRGTGKDAKVRYCTACGENIGK